MSNHPQKSGSLCSGMSGSLCSGIGGSLYPGIGGSLYSGMSGSLYSGILNVQREFHGMPAGRHETLAVIGSFFTHFLFLIQFEL